MKCAHGIPLADMSFRGLGCECCGGPASVESQGHWRCFTCAHTLPVGTGEVRVERPVDVAHGLGYADGYAEANKASMEALAAAEALEARYVAGIRHAIRALHAVHSTLPDGETVPRQSADAIALAVEGALLALLPGGES
jgi:hypothetical protein